MQVFILSEQEKRLKHAVEQQGMAVSDETIVVLNTYSLHVTAVNARNQARLVAKMAGVSLLTGFLGYQIGVFACG